MFSRRPAKPTHPSTNATGNGHQVEDVFFKSRNSTLDSSTPSSVSSDHTPSITDTFVKCNVDDGDYQVGLPSYSGRCVTSRKSFMASLLPCPTPDTGRFALALDGDAIFQEVDSCIDCSILSSVSSVPYPNGGSHHVEGLDGDRDYQVDYPRA
jgi:hypothetical protein